MNIKIRAMNTDDKAEVLEMMRVFYATSAVHTDGSAEIFLSDFNNCVNDNPYLEGFVLECEFEHEEKICGYAMTAKSFSTEYGKPCVWIEDIYIKEAFRGKGIGKAFFAFIEDRYPGVLFRLEAEEENTAAVSLYKSVGYESMPYLELKKQSYHI